MKFFYEEGQPAIRSSVVTVIRKGFQYGNKFPIHFVLFDSDGESIDWLYNSAQERDTALDAILTGQRFRKFA